MLCIVRLAVQPNRLEPLAQAHRNILRNYEVERMIRRSKPWGKHDPYFEHAYPGSAGVARNACTICHPRLQGS